MLQKITDLIQEILSFSSNDQNELELFRLKYLSKKGIITELFENFKNVANTDKREVGQKLNLLKQTALEKYNLLKSELLITEDNSTASDLTRPSFPYPTGSRHPISIVRNEIQVKPTI